MIESRQTEPNWNRISGLFPRTRSKRIYIHPPLSDTLVEVRPDFTLLIKDALGRRGDLRRGHGFFIGEEQGAKPRFFDYRNVEQALLAPQEPILHSSIKQADFDHNLTSLTLKASDGGLRIYQFLTVTNLHPTQARTGEWYFLNVEASHRDFYRHVNEDYVPYESRAEAWFSGMPLAQRAINETSGCLIGGEGETILRYKADPTSHVEYAAEAGDYRNVLQFQMHLAPGETKQIQIEIFDTGHLPLAQWLQQQGLIDDPVMVQLCMGIPWGAPDDLATLVSILHNLPKDWVFSAFSIGRNQLPYAALAVLAGGNIRVGLEDNIWLEKGVLASNGDLVARARTIAVNMGAKVLTPAEVRQKLKLTKRW